MDSSAQTRVALPLERKLPLVVLGLFAAIFIVSLGVSYFEIRQAAIEAAGDRLSALGKVFGSSVEQGFTTRFATMRRLSHDTAVQAALRAPDRAPSAAAIKALAALSTAPADTATPAQLWTAQGQPLGNRHLEPAGETQEFRDDLLKLAASDESTHVGHMRQSNGRTVFHIAVPVRAADHSLLGFIVQERRINVNAQALPLLRGLIGSDIEFFLRNADDNSWIQFSGAGAAAPISARPILDSLTVYTHAKTGEMLASTAPIHGTPLLITVERPMSAILSRPLGTIRGLIVVAIILAMLGAIAVWLFSRRIVSPLGELTRAAEGMAHGHYDRRVAVAKNDEIGRLGLAFNRMAQEVESSSETSNRALSQLTQAMDTQQFLAEASRIVSGSVSDETMLTDLAQYCVPRLADYCSIHVLDDDGNIRRMETAHRDPAKLPLLRNLQRRFPYRVDGPGEVAQVVRTQQPLLMPTLDLPGLIRSAPDTETARLLEQVGPTSFMCVPLIVRAHAFGAMSFTMTDSGRVFDQADLEVALELARRTAVAMDNAVIYRRSVALRLEAEAASSAKSDFLAKMSHEIRTPINAMMGYAELMQMGISGPVTEAQAKQLARIRSSGDHLTSLINEILDLAKIEAGRMAVQSETAPVGDAVEGALTIVRPVAASKGVELAKVDGDSGVEYVGDPQRVQQILTNLLTNAVKFTPAGGRVLVRCHSTARLNGDGEWVCVTVEDTGVGIDADDIERIFHPFVQVETGYTRSQGGTGLGLTISRNLAHLMGGNITVESELGHGSRFTLWLPCPIRALAVT